MNKTSKIKEEINELQKIAQKLFNLGNMQEWKKTIDLIHQKKKEIYE